MAMAKSSEISTYFTKLYTDKVDDLPTLRVK